MGKMTPEKTWEVFPVLVDCGADGNYTVENKKVLFGIKQALLLGTFPWTVVASSDSVNAGASDYWIDQDDLVWGTTDGTARSWIVLKNTAISDETNGFQLLIDCFPWASNAAYTYTASMWISNQGFTGGSNTARPTATDEVQILNVAAWTSSSTTELGTPYTRNAFIAKSTDGECTRIYLNRASASCGFWMFDRIKNPAADIDPFICCVIGNAVSPTAAQLLGASTFYTRSVPSTPATATTAKCTTVIVDTSAIQRIAGYRYGLMITGEWYAFPFGIDKVTIDTPQRVGDLYDLWLISSSMQEYRRLEGVGGTDRIICVGDGIAQPSDANTNWWKI
jgi:hypothetical protein